MEITSLTNPKVKQWGKYKEKKVRDLEQCFLIEGEHLIQEAHSAGIIEELIVEVGHSPLYPNYKTTYVSKEILHKLSTSVSGTWIMAVCHYPKVSLQDLKERILLLDDVQDPGNVGTMIRSAYSFGFDSVVLSNQSVDVYNEKVIRSTQGALFHMPIIRHDLKEVISHLKKENIPVVATALKESIPLSKFPKMEKIALVFGNEGKGVSEEILSLADQKLTIEMTTFESLNVAVAAGICLYHFKK